VRWLRYMLIFVPIAVVAEYVPAVHNSTLIFLSSALALIPLAGLLGEATEELAIHTGPKIGGLLNATLGNAAELIITIVALTQGKFELIKASITGSIIGNLLLILGFALLLGGLRHGTQRFDAGLTGMSAAMMLLAVAGLLVPTLFELMVEVEEGRLDVFNTSVQDPRLNTISLGVASILIIAYILSLVYQLRDEGGTLSHGGHSAGTSEQGEQDDAGKASTPAVSSTERARRAHRPGETHSGVEETDDIVEHKAKWSVGFSFGVLAICTALIVLMSEFLVGQVEPVAERLGVRELFLGVILIPLVGNVAEHLVGVQAALKNQMDLSMTISLGSSMQIALFVAPALVFISLLFGPELTLFFSLFEVMVLGLSVLIAAFISVDGESNWLEGAMLLALYLIAAFGFFYL
jgi:Ca2+:H+ antiporter